MLWLHCRAFVSIYSTSIFFKSSISCYYDSHESTKKTFYPLERSSRQRKHVCSTTSVSICEIVNFVLAEQLLRPLLLTLYQACPNACLYIYISIRQYYSYLIQKFLKFCQIFVRDSWHIVKCRIESLTIVAMSIYLYIKVYSIFINFIETHLRINALKMFSRRIYLAVKNDD